MRSAYDNADASMQPSKPIIELSDSHYRVGGTRISVSLGWGTMKEPVVEKLSVDS